MTHGTRAVILALALAACGPAKRFVGDAGTTDTPPDTAADTGVDTAADTHVDTHADTHEDTAPDTHEDTAGEPDAAPLCGNGVVEAGEQCDGDAPEVCETACGSTGTRTCVECAWSECCAPAETCGNGCDDDCSGVADDGCSSVPNDTCSSPTSVTAGGRFTGDTSLAGNDTTGSTGCTGNGPDVYFTFTLATASDVFIATYGSSFDTVLYIGPTCGSTATACADDSTTFGTGVRQTEIQIDNLAAGTYFITLDGFVSTDRGPYVLDFYSSVTTAPGNRCSDPLPLDTTHVAGATCSMTNVFTPSCASSSASDQVFYLYVPTTRTGTLTTCNTVTDFDTVLHLRSVCDDATTELACNDDASGCTLSTAGASTITRGFSPGLYYVVADGFGSACGSFQIDTTGL
jgi:hypothetical protein